MISHSKIKTKTKTEKLISKTESGLKLSKFEKF